MNIEISLEQRIAFREWLREHLRKLEFYQRRGDLYLIRQFAYYCAEKGHPIDEASLGRYTNRENPVVPTPQRCRDLAAVFGLPAVEVMKAAGLVRDSDWEAPVDTSDDEDESDEKGA